MSCSAQSGRIIPFTGNCEEEVYGVQPTAPRGEVLVTGSAGNACVANLDEQVDFGAPRHDRLKLFLIERMGARRGHREITTREEYPDTARGSCVVVEFNPVGGAVALLDANCQSVHTRSLRRSLADVLDDNKNPQWPPDLQRFEQPDFGDTYPWTLLRVKGLPRRLGLRLSCASLGLCESERSQRRDCTDDDCHKSKPVGRGRPEPLGWANRDSAGDSGLAWCNHDGAGDGQQSGSGREQPTHMHAGLSERQQHDSDGQRHAQIAQVGPQVGQGPFEAFEVGDRHRARLFKVVLEGRIVVGHGRKAAPNLGPAGGGRETGRAAERVRQVEPVRECSDGPAVSAEGTTEDRC